MHRAHLLIVDDDRLQRAVSTQFMSRKLGYAVEDAEDGEKALTRLCDMQLPMIDLVVLDLYMPHMDGREVLKRIRLIHPTMPVIMLTASGDLEDAVALMQMGASDFIAKPFSAERLRLSIEQHLTIRALSSEVARLKRSELGQGRFDDLVGATGGLAVSVAYGRKAAISSIPVLISGESGVGKEIMARAIHGEGPRAGRPFTAINCGAIPENLVESTLFGHEKGSFTGAIARELGKFREADGGTLFLDEVGELKPDMQTKLLRVLQQKEIEPVGAGKPVRVNVRILSATNRNLESEVAAGRFREDLYYRLNVFPIAMPPLRDRAQDIPALALHMVALFCATEHKKLLRLEPEALDWLSRQSWPGNVRELENLLYRAVVLNDTGELTLAELTAMLRYDPKPAQFAGRHDRLSLLGADGVPRSMEALEMEIINATLARTDDNIAETARILGMGQSTIYKRLAGRA